MKQTSKNNHIKGRKWNWVRLILFRVKLLTDRDYTAKLIENEYLSSPEKKIW